MQQVVNSEDSLTNEMHHILGHVCSTKDTQGSREVQACSQLRHHPVSSLHRHVVNSDT